MPVPLRSVLRSPPFWAILVANTGHTWGFYTLLTDLPLYMKNMLQENINSVGSSCKMVHTLSLSLCVF